MQGGGQHEAARDRRLRVAFAGSKIFAPTLTSLAALIAACAQRHSLSIYAKYPNPHPLAPGCAVTRLDYGGVASWPRHYDLAHVLAGDTAARILDLLPPSFPVVLTCESGGDFTRRIQDGVKAAAYERQFARASIITFIHSSTVRLAHSRCRIDEAKQRVFDPCLPMRSYPLVDVTKNDLRVAVVGREVPEKGRGAAERVLAAGEIVHKAYFIGADPPAEGGDERFEFTGIIPHESYISLLMQCRLLLYAGATEGSRFDSLPTTFLEALAMGIPVVSTPIAGAQEIAQLFPDALRLGDTREDLAAHVHDILTEAVTGERVSAYVRERFSLGRIVDDVTERLYPLALGRRTASRLAVRRATLKRPRPVLLVCEDYSPDPGGLAASARRISGLIAASRQTTVICFQRMDPDRPFTCATEIRSPNLIVHRLGPFTKGWSTGRSWEGHTAMVIEQALRWIVSSGALGAESLVIGFGLKSAGVLADRLRAVSGLPLIQCVRGNDLSRNLFDVDRFPEVRSALDSTDAVVAVNRQLADLVQVAFPHVSSRLTVIPNGVSQEFLTAAARLPPYERRWQTAVYPLGYVGTLREQKNPGLIAHLIEHVLRPRGTLFRVVGSLDDDIRTQCGYRESQALPQEWVSAWRAMDARELAASIGEIRVGIFPSIVEGLSNAMLETAACSVPVVGTEAASDLLAHVDDGLICSPFAPDEAVDLVLELLSSPSLCRDLGEKARGAVMAEFTPEREMGRWNDLFARFDC